jgi:pyruvate/2-oxoglutarate dehydrogenase complex dihydrolipoamide dehydrogenase (E3) component
MARRYDLVVLGGGTAGLVSSLIAAGLGARVALIEREHTGGDCLWTGCVPSKTLLAAASLAHRMRHADAVGLTPVEPSIDARAVMDSVWRAITTIAPSDSVQRLRDAGVEVITAAGSFAGVGLVRAGERELRYRSAIIATGSQPVLPPIPGLPESQPLSTDTLWQLRELPRTLVVLGGGAVGCELGQGLARLGVSVTIVEMSDRLLPRDEPDAGRLLHERFKAEGIEVRVGARVVSVHRDGKLERLMLEGAAGRETLSCERILVAAGRAPRTDALDLYRVGVDSDGRGAVTVDASLRTSARGVFAAGDVTAQMPFTHVAAHHARVATPNALFHTHMTVSQLVPWVTFTDPEVASVGLSEADARVRWGTRATIARRDNAELDRAITAAETSGFVKLVADPSGRLVGATIVGTGAGESIAELTAWIAGGAKLATISRTIHAYPTFAEGAARAADELLARRYSTPTVRALARPVLTALRMLER